MNSSVLFVSCPVPLAFTKLGAPKIYYLNYILVWGGSCMKVSFFWIGKDCDSFLWIVKGLLLRDCRALLFFFSNLFAFGVFWIYEYLLISLYFSNSRDYVVKCLSIWNFSIFLYGISIFSRQVSKTTNNLRLVPAIDANLFRLNSAFQKHFSIVSSLST